MILFRAGNAGGQPRTQTTEDKLIMITITTVTGKRAINQRTDAGTFFQRTIKQKFKLRNNPDMQNLAQAVAQETGGMIQHINRFCGLHFVAQHGHVNFCMCEIPRHGNHRDTDHTQSRVIDFITDQFRQLTLYLIADAA